MVAIATIFAVVLAVAIGWVLSRFLIAQWNDFSKEEPSDDPEDE